MNDRLKYTFRKYSDEYPRLFLREKYRLRQILTKDAQLYHIGSTAVPGLGGKGIIDIRVAVSKRAMTRNKNRLQKAGYVFRPAGGNKQRLFFQKDYWYAGKVRRVHVHLTYHGSCELIPALSVVEYLKNHPESVREYSRLKLEAVKQASGDGKKYRAFKSEFLEWLSKLAMSTQFR